MTYEKNDAECLLKRTLEREIELINTIHEVSQLPELATGESTASASKLAELVEQFRTTRQELERKGDSEKDIDDSVDVARLREVKRSALIEAIAAIRKVEERVVAAKNEVLTELSAVNRSQQGHNTYVKQ